MDKIRDLKIQSGRANFEMGGRGGGGIFANGIF